MPIVIIMFGGAINHMPTYGDFQSMVAMVALKSWDPRLTGAVRGSASRSEPPI